MKMTAIAAAVAFASCTKDRKETNLTEPEVNLTSTTYFKDGSVTVQTENNDSINHVSHSIVFNDGTNNKIRVSFGQIEKVEASLPTTSFSLSLVFGPDIQYDHLGGMYEFPFASDNGNVRVAYSARSGTNAATTNNSPSSGSVRVFFDPVSNTVSGDIDITWQFSGSEALNRNKITIRGTFKKVPVE